MDRVDQMRLFARVAETGSFSVAATAEHVAQSTVSKQVAALEQRLGAQLLRRTPRGLSLTEAGRTYHALAVELLADFEAADAQVRASSNSVNGHLRISTSPLLASDLIVPHLSELFERFPDLSLDLDVSERYVRLVEEGFDLAIRVGRLKDASLVANKIGCLEALIVASPNYLQRWGTPLTPDDLQNHVCLPFMFQGNPKPWRFRDGDRHISLGSGPIKSLASCSLG